MKHICPALMSSGNSDLKHSVIAHIIPVANCKTSNIWLVEFLFFIQDNLEAMCELSPD